MCDQKENTIRKMFKQFKLGQTLITCKYTIDQELMSAAKLPEEEIEKIIKRQISQSLAEKILSNRPSSIKEMPTEDGTRQYGAQFMVLEIDEFKTIVEAAIQMLPEEKIIQIRNGEV